MSAGPLASFGVGRDAEALYRRVLREPNATLAHHAGVLRWQEDRAVRCLESLMALRLVREDAEARLSADHPRSGIQRLIDRETARLDLRRREMDEVRAAISDFAADHLAGRESNEAVPGLVAIPEDLAAATVEDLIRTTKGTIRSAHLTVGTGPAVDRSLDRMAREEVRAGRRLRSIYPLEVLDVPDQLQWVRGWAEVGEEQRVVQHVPHDFSVFGTEAVAAGQDWGAGANGIVVIRAPLLVQAFTTVFEDAWAGGLPVPDEVVEADEQTRLLGLLGAGFKDEAIARYLGVGLRTVRRRVADLMEVHGTHTRFQLGAAAQRRGLLRQERPRAR